MKLPAISAAPWTVRDTETHAEIDAPDHATLAMVATSADAKAIAAVPAMLEALMELLGQFDQAHDALCVERSPSAQAAIAEARAALRLAGATEQ